VAPVGIKVEVTAVNSGTFSLIVGGREGIFSAVMSVGAKVGVLLVELGGGRLGTRTIAAGVGKGVDTVRLWIGDIAARGVGRGNVWPNAGLVAG
jgi:hypothetical protein